MRSRYQTMIKSLTETDSVTGEAYYDVLTFPIELFTYTQTTIEYPLTKNDLQRIDNTMNTYYGVAEFDDIVLWLNDIPFIHDSEAGDLMKLPRKKDIERFFTQFTQ